MAGVVIITVKTDSPENTVLRGLLRQLLLPSYLVKAVMETQGDQGRDRKERPRPHPSRS